MNASFLIVAIALLTPAGLLAQTIPGGWECPPPAGIAPNGDDGCATVLKDNRWIYVLDRSGFFVYDVKAPAAWVRKADFPGIPTEGCGAGVGSGKIWAMPGGGDLNFYSYDPATDVWAAAPELPSSSYNTAMTSDGKLLYLIAAPSYRVGAPEAGTFYSLDTSAAAPSWTLLPEVPFGFGMIGACAGVVNGDVYASGGGEWERRIFKYSAGAWSETGFSTPARPGIFPPGVSPAREMGLNGALVSDGTHLLCHPGTPFFAFRGPELEAVGLWRRNDLNKWEKVTDFPGADKPSGYGFPCGTNTVVATDTKKLYYYRSGGTSDLWILDLAANPPAWSLASTSAAPLALPFVNDAGTTKIVGQGGSMVSAGRTLYVMAGNSTADFLSMDTSLDVPAWTKLAPLPATIGGRSNYNAMNGTTPVVYSNDDGGSLAYDGSRWIYAVGNGLNAWRYDATAAAPGAWIAIPSLPDGHPTSTSAKLVHVPADATLGTVETLYLFGEIYTARLLKWVVGSPAWTYAAQAPDNLYPGFAPIYPDGGRTIYLFHGSDNQLWGYDIVLDKWNKPFGSSDGFDPADLPQGIGTGNGAALCHPGSGKLVYALLGSGHNEIDAGVRGNELWAYQLPDTGTGSNTWTRLGPAGFMVSMGGSLVYPARGAWLYAAAGNNTGIVARYQIPNEVPALAGTQQLKRDGVTPIPAGGSSFEGGWQVSLATVDGDNDDVSAEVQYRLLGEAAWRSIVSDEFVPGGTATLFVPTAVSGNYEWRARASDVRGGVSAWSDFNGGTGATDVRVRAQNLLPVATPVLVDDATGEVMAAGSRFPYGHFGVKVSARLDDPDGLGDRGRIEIRIHSTATGAVVAGESGNLADPGSPTSATCTIETEGYYGIEYRYVDEFGLAGGWTALSGEAFDVHIPRNGSTGPSGCGQSAGVSIGLLAAVAALLAGRRP